MASVNNDTLNGLIRHFKDDKDDLDMIVKAIETFEAYHQAIYRLEIMRRLFSTRLKPRPIERKPSSGIEAAPSTTMQSSRR